MKKSLATLLALTMLLALFTVGPSAAFAEAPAEKHLTWARDYESTSLDPAESSDDESSNIVSYTTEGLTRVMNGVPQPGVAESWDVSEDGKTVTFHLRESKWADGTPVYAEDFVYAFFRLIDPAAGHSQASGGYIIKNAQEYAEGACAPEDVGFKALDQHTVEVTFKDTGLENLFHASGYVPLKREFVEQAGEAYGSTKETVFGNGPFIIAEWQHESKIVLTKNEYYWNAENIHLTAMTGLANVTNDTAAEMMLTGEIDLAAFAKPEYYQQLYDAGFEGTTYCGTYQFLHINQRGKSEAAGKFLSNVNFRLALNYAIDRAAICSAILSGQTPATRFVDPGANGVNGKFIDEYPLENGINATADPAKAKEYLDKALTELGATIEDVPELYMLCYESQNSQTQLQAYQDMFLTVLGIKCVIDPQPIQQMIGKVYAYDYDFWLGGVAIGAMDAASQGGALTYWDMDNPDALFGYNNPEYAKLLDKAQQTLDYKERCDAIAEMEKLFCAEVPDLLITWQTQHVLYKPGIVITNIDASYGADLAFCDIVAK